MYMNEVYVPFDSPLNDYQRSLIRKPYNESGMTRAMAYARQTDGIVASILSPAEMFSPPNDVPADEVAGFNTVMASTAGTVGFSLGFYPAAAAVAEQTALAALPFLVGLGTSLASLVIFEGAVICTRILQIHNSPAYKTWKDRRAVLMQYKAMIDFLKKDEILNALLCPITGNIPLLPAKTRFDITYDYEAAIRWIDQNPGKPLPKSPQPVTRQELRFDYAHINSICTRLGNLQTVVRNEMNQLMCDRLRLINLTGENASRWIAVAELLILRGDLTRSEAFFGHEGLMFTQRVFTKCGQFHTRGNMNRRAEYYKEWEEIRRSPENRNRQSDLVLARIELLALRANVIKKVYRTPLINQDDAFLKFGWKLFRITPRNLYSYRVSESIDLGITAFGDQGWAVSLGLRSINDHGD